VTDNNSQHGLQNLASDVERINATLNPRNDRKRMLLVPTEFERAKLQPHLKCEIHICGFGPIAAAARAAELIASQRPKSITLIGIAGTFNETDLPVKSAAVFREVVVDGIGVGADHQHRSAEEVGFAQWHSQGDEIHNRLALIVPADSTGLPIAKALLTVGSASGGRGDADWRRARFPTCKAEDMEAFGVALACRLASVPLTVVRGISNLVGDRRKENWAIDAALESAAGLVKRLANP